MKHIEVLMVRIYFTEHEKLLDPILTYLKDDAKINGISVFRAVKGYGKSGEHTSTLLDLSLDLPLVIEFFDLPEKVSSALLYLQTIVKPKHIVTWTAQTYEPS
jgi:PII-like signaling protein